MAIKGVSIERRERTEAVSIERRVNPNGSKPVINDRRNVVQNFPPSVERRVTTSLPQIKLPERRVAPSQPPPTGERRIASSVVQIQLPERRAQQPMVQAVLPQRRVDPAPVPPPSGELRVTLPVAVIHTPTMVKVAIPERRVTIQSPPPVERRAIPPPTRIVQPTRRVAKFDLRNIIAEKLIVLTRANVVKMIEMTVLKRINQVHLDTFGATDNLQIKIDRTVNYPDGYQIINTLPTTKTDTMTPEELAVAVDPSFPQLIHQNSLFVYNNAIPTYTEQLHLISAEAGGLGAPLPHIFVSLMRTLPIENEIQHNINFVHQENIPNGAILLNIIASYGFGWG